MVQGLPTADSLLPSIAALERKLAQEEEGFRARVTTATSTDGAVTATANGMVEMVAVTLAEPPWPPADAAAITALAASVKDACAKVLSQVNAATKPVASAAAVGYALTGIPNQGQTAPLTRGFSSAETDIATRLRGQDPIIAARQFQGIAGSVGAVVDGALNLLGVTLTAPLPLGGAVLENQVVAAVNIALEKAKDLFEEGIRNEIDGGDFPVRPGKCLLVVGAVSPLDAADAALQARLVAMRLTVILRASASLATADASGVGVVIVTQTAVATQVGTKLRDVTTPVLLTNQTLFDEMKMTGTTSADQGNVTAETRVDILLPGHPLAAGLTGNVQVRSTPGTLVWGKPATAAIKVASLPGQPTKLVVFGYETGAQMVGLAAPARRAAWFGNRPSPTTLTDAAWALFEAVVRWLNVPNSALDTVTFPEVCLFAAGNMQLGDRVKIKRQDNSFAAIANAGPVETNIGVDAQVGDVWSRAKVVLRGAKVNGFVKSAGSVDSQNQTAVTRTITEFANITIPSFTLGVTFPTANKGAVSIEPNLTKTIDPGAYADVVIKGGATLFLSTGTYHFNKWTVESQAKISCTSTTGQITVYVKNGFIFRGSIVEKTGGGRPKLFVGVFGVDSVPIEGPFTGILAAPNAQVTLATVGAPGHTGAFHAKNLTVGPDNTIVHFPFAGPPILGN